MAELEVSVKYNYVPAKIGLGLMAITLPIWALLIPFGFGLLINQLLRDPGSLAPATALLALAIMGGIPFACTILAAICEDDRILVSKEGLTFPLMMLFALGLRKERLWSDLQSVYLRGDPAKPRAISLHFRSGGHITIRLSRISKDHLEQLLLATEVWGTECKRAPALIEFQNRLQNESKGIEHLSYTQMWEEELSRRFNATSFVPLEPGQLIDGGHIKIVRQLAFGGLSAIYLAQQDERELVVIKEAVVPANADASARLKAMELFQREASFLMRLAHPQIARVLKHFTEGGRSYLLLEYIQGQDLRQLVRQNGPQPEARVLDWALEVKDILGYLHAQEPPIIHRDLTPENLVCRDDGTLVLIDFGAANEFVGTATGTLVGKQSYIAPEQFRGKAVTQSDIYALGGTLHFLLTGEDPVPLSQSHPRRIRETVSEAVDALVAACTTMEVADRISSTDELGAKIIQVMQDSGSTETCRT